MKEKIIRDKEHPTLTAEQVIVHNQCVIHDILMGLFEAVDKAGLGFVYGGAVVEAQKKFKEYNDSVKLVGPGKTLEKIKKETKEEPNKSLIKPERQGDNTKITPL